MATRAGPGAGLRAASKPAAARVTPRDELEGGIKGGGDEGGTSKAAA